MQKAELRKLRALPATKEMMEKGKKFKEVEERYWYTGKTRKVIKHEYGALFRVQNLSSYIKIAVFLPEDMRKDIKSPRYEIFLNVNGEEYTTRELDKNGKETRWLSSMLTNLPDVPGFGYWSNTKYFINKDGMDTLNRLDVKNGKGNKGAYRLQQWQQEQKDKETKRREAKEQKPWDEDMALVPKIMPSFEEWMRKEAPQEYFIFYDYDKKGAKIGYCSRCKKQIQISNPKHNKQTRCKACGAKAEFKSSGRIQTLSTSWYYAEAIQKINGGIVVRRFSQYQYYRDRPYKNPHINTHECERTLIFDNGIIRHYMWDSYKNKYHRWILDKSYIPNSTYYRQRTTKLYKKNLASLKQHTLLKQSAMDVWPELPTSVTSYITIEKGNPAVEKLARIGMFKLAKGIIRSSYDRNLLDQNETELAKMLKVDKSRLKRLAKMDASVEMLKWMQAEKKANTVWPDEMIRDFGNAHIETDDFYFLQIKMSYVKCHNYLVKQANLTGESLKQTLISWEDYLEMAEKMKMNVKIEQIAKPKNLKQAHDELVINMQKGNLEKKAKELEETWPKVNNQLAKLKKFEYTAGEYSIVAPKEILDIVVEGTILRHCVHTCDYYFDRIQKDESYLFFLRRSEQPDMPWYTLEVEPSGNIRQKRTTGDNQNEDFQDALKFLKKWQRHFKKQLTQEEKKLGEKANKKRLESYKELREKGNRVWHGKLAGQLLADVLEKDFMEAI